MIIEISIRIISYNKVWVDIILFSPQPNITLLNPLQIFFSSYGNIVDLIIVLSTTMMLIYLVTGVVCEDDNQIISETGGILSLTRNIIQLIRAATLIKKGAERDLFFIDSGAEESHLNMDLQSGKDESETLKWISGKLSWKAPGPNPFSHPDDHDL